MNCRLALALFLFGTGTPLPAFAEDFVLSGGGLPADGALISDYAYGAQATPDGTGVIEQPLVLNRKYDADAVTLLQAFSKNAPLAPWSLLPSSTFSFRLGFSVTGPVIQSYTHTLFVSGQVGQVGLGAEQMTLRYSGLSPSTTLDTAPLPTTQAIPFRVLALGSGAFDALAPATRTSILSASFGFEHPVSSTGVVGSGVRLYPLVLNRVPRRGTGTDNGFFLAAVRAGTVFPTLELKLLADETTQPPLAYWRFYEAVVTSVRSVESSATNSNPFEQINITYKRAEYSSPTGKVAFQGAP